jgi:hypothetical protein
MHAVIAVIIQEAPGTTLLVTQVRLGRFPRNDVGFDACPGITSIDVPNPTLGRPCPDPESSTMLSSP